MKQTNEIKRTNNYDMFKRLEGNRFVDPKKVNKLKKSINEVGYISNPIIVNEKMEVIDGQHRLEALKELGNKQLQKGGLEVSQFEYENAIIKLNYLNRYIPTFKHLLGRTTYFCQAIMVVYDMEKIDRERLLKQISENVRVMIPWSDFNSCLSSIEDIYNKQLNFKNRVDIYKLYRQGLISAKRNTAVKYDRPGLMRERELNRKIRKQEGKKYEIEIRQNG